MLVFCPVLRLLCGLLSCLQVISYLHRVVTHRDILMVEGVYSVFRLFLLSARNSSTSLA